MKFEEYYIASKQEIQTLLKGDNENIKHALIGGANGIKDWKWMQDVALEYIYHDDFWVSKTAIDVLSDISRIHKKIDVKKIRHVLSIITNERLKPTIQSTLDDIELFVVKI